MKHRTIVKWMIGKNTPNRRDSDMAYYSYGSWLCLSFITAQTLDELDTHTVRPFACHKYADTFLHAADEALRAV